MALAPHLHGTPNEFGGHDLTGPNGCVRSASKGDGEGMTVHRFDRKLNLVWTVEFSPSAPYEPFEAAWLHGATEIGVDA